MQQNSEKSNQALQVLNQSELCGRQFTVYGTAEQPLFKAADVAEMIEHSNITRMLEMVDDDEKGVNQLLTPGGIQQVWFLTEDGLYEVLMQSRKPIAKEFKKGVKTILKEIRTKGGYIAAKADDTPEILMARALKIADETMKRQQKELEAAQQTIDSQNVQIQAAQGQIEEQQKRLDHIEPMAQYTREVLQSTSTFTLTQVAKDLGFVSIHKFTAWAQERGILYYQSGQWLPTSKHSGNGYFTTRTTKYVKADDTVGTNIYTVVTERGRAWLHQLIDKTKAA